MVEQQRRLPAAVVLLLVLLGVATAAPAGQKELMENWTAKKQAVADQVYERLRQEGKLPKDGSVSFSAHTRPDPQHPGRTIIEVDRVEILPPPGAGSQAPATGDSGGKAPEAKAPLVREEPLDWQPMTLPGLVSYESLDIPVEQEFKGRFEVRKGVMLPVNGNSGRVPAEKPGEKAPAEP